MTTTHPYFVPILMYHSVNDDAHSIDLPFTVRPDDFDRQVEALRSWGAHTITVAQYAAALEARTPVAPRTVVITVDDGYADTADHLLPALARAGLTATVFVSTGTIGRVVRNSAMIDWPQIRDLHAAGIEVGGHSHHHIALDTVGAQRAAGEMVRCRETLEAGLGARVTSFAYPHGYYTRRLCRLVELSGYTAACAAKNAMSHPFDDRFALARVVVSRGMSADELIDIADGTSVGPWSSERVAQRLAWRLARRSSQVAPSLQSVLDPVAAFCRRPMGVHGARATRKAAG